MEEKYNETLVDANRKSKLGNSNELKETITGSLPLIPSLAIKVDRPEKIVATMESYVVYRVHTMINNRSDFIEPEYEVYRRYTDFVWLRLRLDSEFPMYFLPPLPEKHSMYSLDRFEPKFVKARCYLLYLFMKALLDLPKCTRNADFQAFITLNERQWIGYRKNAGDDVGGWGAWLPMYTAQSLDKVLPDIKVTEFAEKYNFCQQLSETLIALERMTSRIMHTDAQYAGNWSSVQTVLAHWQETETSHFNFLDKMSQNNNSDNCAGMSYLEVSQSNDSVMLADLVNAAHESAQASDMVAQRFELDMLLPLTHLARYCHAVLAVLRRREHLHQECLKARESYLRKLADLEQIVVSASKDDKAGSQRKAKLKATLEELRFRHMHTTQLLTEADAIIRDEWQRWSVYANTMHRRILAGWAQQRAMQYQKSMEAWQRAVNTLATNN